MVDYIQGKYNIADSFMPKINQANDLSRGGSVSMPAMDMGVMPKGQSKSQADLYSDLAGNKVAC